MENLQSIEQVLLDSSLRIKQNYFQGVLLVSDHWNQKVHWRGSGSAVRAHCSYAIKGMRNLEGRRGEHNVFVRYTMQRMVRVGHGPRESNRGGGWQWERIVEGSLSSACS